jgi:hypothetical protein
MAPIQRLIFVGGMLVVAGCGIAIPRPDQAMVDRAYAAGKPVELARLEQGYRLYTTRCAGCHALPIPGETPASEWPQVVRLMAKRAKVDAPSADMILAYVLAAESAVEHPGR